MLAPKLGGDTKSLDCYFVHTNQCHHMNVSPKAVQSSRDPSFYHSNFDSWSRS